MEPNDQMGSTLDPPWAGLWVMDFANFGEPGGHKIPTYAAIIAVLQPDQTVSLYTYETEEEMRAAWVEFEKTIENPVPAKGDLVIWQEQIDVSLSANQEVKDFIPGGWRATDSHSGWGIFPSLEKIIEFLDLRGYRGKTLWLREGDHHKQLEWP